MEFIIQIRKDLTENLKKRSAFLGKTVEQLIEECLEELAEVDDVKLALPRLKQLLETDTSTTRRTLREQTYRL